MQPSEMIYLSSWKAIWKVAGIVLKKKKKCRAPEWRSWLNERLLIWAQVMISRFMRSNPTSGSVLTVRTLLGILSFPFPLSAPPLLARKLARSLSLSLSLSLKINKLKRKKKTTTKYVPRTHCAPGTVRRKS